MCIYCTTTNYRKIYEHHVGPIPKDDKGRSYDIHHVDGDNTNNNPSNLKAVSLMEHYDIHYNQGDWGACLAIMRRMESKTPEEMSRLSSMAAKKRIDDGTFHFNKENAKNYAQIQTERGTRYWGSKKQAERLRSIHKQLVEQGIHPLQGAANPVHKRVEDGSHHFLGPSNNLNKVKMGTHPSQMKMTCPHCGTTMDKMNYAKHHGDNCSLIKEKIPPSANPNYVNSMAKKWLITDTLTNQSYEIIGLRTWALRNSFNPSSVTWAVNKHNRYKHFIIKQVKSQE
jgi:hypothetical protein